MELVMGGLVSLLLAVVGAALWTVVSYYLHVEVGYLAWGIGVLSGLGMRFASKRAAGVKGGIIAALISVAAVGAGKYTVLYYKFVQQAATVHLTPQQLRDDFAFIVQAQTKRDGRTLSASSSENEASPEATAQAEKNWDAMSPTQRHDMEDKMTEAYRNQLKSEAAEQSLKYMTSAVGPFDILWVFLAVSSAYRIGKGGTVRRRRPARPRQVEVASTNPEREQGEE